MPHDRVPILHIGYAKAASSTLQEAFGKAPQLRYIDPMRTCIHLVARNPSLFDEDAARGFFAEEIQKAHLRGQTPVISHERLSGGPFSGHYDAQDIGARLRRLFPTARVLICIREQMAMLASIYKQYVRVGGVAKPRQFFVRCWWEGWHAEYEWWDFHVPLFDWRAYQYAPLIRYYRELFGEDNVCVLPIEYMLSAPEQTAARLENFFGTPFLGPEDLQKKVNVGLSDLDAKILRVTNFLRTDPCTIRDPLPTENPLLAQLVASLLRDAMQETSADIEAEVRALFAGKYCPSNRETSELIAMNLAQAGYEV